MDLFRDALPSGGIIARVGSRATCSPPPMDTDEDFLVLVRSRADAVTGLMELGFEAETDPEKIQEYMRLGDETGGAFTSLRFGDVNYIVTEDVFFFERFLTGAYVARALNLMDKKDRILVHSAIRGATFANAYCPEFNPHHSLFWPSVKVVGEEPIVSLTNGEVNTRLKASVSEAVVRQNAAQSDCPF